jgi:hypothetical protein
MLRPADGVPDDPIRAPRQTIERASKGSDDSGMDLLGRRVGHELLLDLPLKVVDGPIVDRMAPTSQLLGQDFGRLPRVRDLVISARHRGPGEVDIMGRLLTANGGHDRSLPEVPTGRPRFAG